ncbi:hypothetical protein DSM100688_1414 [Bifidobacterium ramosum]|uniref:Uncharacterized protein n=3 Tax=Bifidobacterium TaxID=1678 RepID=A0A2M9HSG4_9BIFI|nr:hypothetical protein [Bifidobacterium scaligerum]KAB8287628.1 hypothetical protein DSM100688_1414 [Bifidobacterium ramosum]PJM79755.1 hypothetical protein CUU80_01000 [Bifidobacterium scaligerum]
MNDSGRMKWQMARFLQSLHRRNGLRAMLLVIYAVVVYRFLISGMDPGVFIGMFRSSDSPFTPGLAYNMYALAYALFGMAIPLEQFSEWLAVPECMVYVRRGRGPGRFLAYLLMITVYCVVYTLIQAVAQRIMFPDEDPVAFAGSAVCAACVLLAAMLTANLGYLSGSRIAGYFVVVVLLGLLMSFSEPQQWLLAVGPLHVPNWMPAAILTILICAAANLIAFNRMQIL